MTLLLLAACAPAERPAWTSGEPHDYEALVYAGGSAPSGGGGDAGDDTGAAAAEAACAEVEGSWRFELVPASDTCSIPSATSYSQTLSCGDAGAFTLRSGGLSEECTLQGSSFGCHTPDTTYSFSLSGSFSGDTASGSWTWRFPSDCDAVSGSFTASR